MWGLGYGVWGMGWRSLGDGGWGLDLAQSSAHTRYPIPYTSCSIRDPYTSPMPRRRRRRRATVIDLSSPRARRRVRRAAWVALAFAVFLGPLLLFTGRECSERNRLAAVVPLIRQHADAAGLPFPLVLEVVRAESSGNPRARSGADARGLMQITPITHDHVLERNRALRRGNLYDPDHNLRVGTLYLSELMRRFDSDLPLVLAAYHMGPTAVADLRRKHPTLDSRALIARHAGPKTRAYVTKVLDRYAAYGG